MNWFDQLNRVPPTLCRLLARKSHGRQPMSNQDIAERGGIARATVAKISKLQNWDKVTFKIARGFCQGCGVDPANMADHREFLQTSRLEFMERASPAQRRMFDRLLKSLRAPAARLPGEVVSDT